MKRIFAAIAAVFLSLLTGCGETREYPVSLVYTALENLPDDYSLSDAKTDRCVVMENGDISAGQEIWDEFVRTAAEGTPMTVRYVTYYTLGDPSRYGEEYYESVRDEYPKMYIHDLSFDGENYTVRWFEDTGEVMRTYKYLVRYEGEAIPSASYSSYVRYVLVNDNSVAWADIEHGMLSSRFGDYIDHFSVYCDYIY